MCFACRCGYQMLILGLLLVFPTLVGCWSGHRMADRELAYRHPSVRWVYRTGGQLGLKFVYPAFVENHVHDLQKGSGCVVVTEGGPGCMTSAPWRPITALNIETGVPMSGQRTTDDEPSFLLGDRSEWLDATRQSVSNLGRNVKLILSESSAELCMTRSSDASEDQIRLATLAASRSFGVPVYALWYDEKTVVVGLFQGYVICIDLSEVWSDWTLLEPRQTGERSGRQQPCGYAPVRPG